MKKLPFAIIGLLILFVVLGCTQQTLAPNPNAETQNDSNFIDTNLLDAAFCNSVSDCNYVEYAGGCYNPVITAQMMKKAAANGEYTGEAAPIDGNVSCTCEQNKCTTHVQMLNLFEKKSNIICTEDGKPIIRYFYSNTCSHCSYIAPIFNSVISEYEGKIVTKQYDILIESLATHSNTDTNNLPESEWNEFSKFNYNLGTPDFSFGCEYYRLGTSFESSKDTNAEAQEFKRVINLLLKENGTQ